MAGLARMLQARTRLSIKDVQQRRYGTTLSNTTRQTEKRSDLTVHLNSVLNPSVAEFHPANREFKIRRLRTTATDKHATAHDQNHVTVHFSRVALRLR